MKTYAQLTETEQAQALKDATDRLLEAIIEGALHFNDELNGDDLQARIDKAAQEADRMQTPWFIGSYIMDTCREDIEAMAQCDAEDAMYLEDGDAMPIRLKITA